MKTIASRDNAIFKDLRRLARSNAAQREEGVALLEGVHLAQALLDAGAMPRRCFVGRSALDDREVGALLDRVEPGRVLVLEDPLYAQVSQLEQGVAILVEIDVPRPPWPTIIETTAVLLDRVQDPGNVGSILRSAAAAGIGDVFLSPDCAGAWSSKVLRAGMGAHVHLRIHEGCDPTSLKAIARIPCIATSSHATATVHGVDLRQEVLWMFGNEGQGLAAELMAGATAIRIPQPGKGESLNVAAAAAVCFFEQVRQRG